jgi:cell division protein FtsW
MGIVCWIAFQALINIGGITRSIPLTGIPLPFVSYGGSSLIMVMAAIGVLLNVSRYSKESPASARAPRRAPAARRAQAIKQAPAALSRLKNADVRAK